MTENTKDDINVVKSRMKEGETKLNSFSKKSRDDLVQYEEHIKTADDTFMQAIESLRREITANSNHAGDKMKGMVSVIVESITKISDSSVETRRVLASILHDLHELSLKTSKQVGQQALEQHTKMENALGTFHSGMKHHDALQNELQEQLSVVNEYGTSQLGKLANQSDSLLKQKQVLAEAREEQNRVHSDIMSSVMHGVEELLSREMNRLAQETEARFNIFETDNNEISKLNASISSVTRDILSETENRNKSMVNLATGLHANDSELYDQSILNNETLMEIKEKLWQHHDHISDVGKQTNEKIADLERLDEPVALAMKKLEEDREATSQYIAGTIIASSHNGFDDLVNKATNQTNFVVEQAIPGVDKAFKELTNEQNVMYGEAFNQLDQIQQSADVAHGEIKDIIVKQTGEIDQLRDMVLSQRNDFENNAIAPRKLSIESRHKAILEDIENHYQFSSDHLSAKTTLLTQLNGDVSSFAATVVHAYDNVPENEPRTQVPFTDKLSSTPSRQNIIANLKNSGLSTSTAGFIDENNRQYKNTYESEIETRDDVKVMIQL